MRSCGRALQLSAKSISKQLKGGIRQMESIQGFSCFSFIHFHCRYLAGALIRCDINCVQLENKLRLPEKKLQANKKCKGQSSGGVPS